MKLMKAQKKADENKKDLNVTFASPLCLWKRGCFPFSRSQSRNLLLLFILQHILLRRLGEKVSLYPYCDLAMDQHPAFATCLLTCPGRQQAASRLQPPPHLWRDQDHRNRSICRHQWASKLQRVVEVSAQEKRETFLISNWTEARNPKWCQWCREQWKGRGQIQLEDAQIQGGGCSSGAEGLGTLNRTWWAMGTWQTTLKKIAF